MKLAGPRNPWGLLLAWTASSHTTETEHQTPPGLSSLSQATRAQPTGDFEAFRKELWSRRPSLDFCRTAGK